jgi:hypothetical protein
MTAKLQKIVIAFASGNCYESVLLVAFDSPASRCEALRAGCKALRDAKVTVR